MAKIKVLFVCIHNSARSQMAEALLKSIGGERFDVRSAGIEPGNLNPLAVEAMRQEGIDISSNLTKSVFDYFKESAIFDYVITVCDESSAERCPIFPGITRRLHWSFEDPGAFQGDGAARLLKTLGVKDQIKAKITEWVKTIN